MTSKRSYAWALAFTRSDEEVRALSTVARDGLEFAQSFARNARLRSEAALAGEMMPEPLGAAELAAGWTTAAHVHNAIRQARRELFGKELSDSAIFYRLKLRREREQRTCAEPECAQTIPRGAHGARRYCSRHGAGWARVARHRRARSTRRD
jgi:hypothetical protein